MAATQFLSESNQMKYVLATNSNFLIPISLQPDMHDMRNNNAMHEVSTVHCYMIWYI